MTERLAPRGADPGCRVGAENNAVGAISGRLTMHLAVA